ncbi:MAG: ATP-dependent Clp protease adaptor ClpS [Saprospiraceae bacterium]|nr:ATP-dependent Clp protease adaptor ClpS [Saprospiraceae bacterium]
MTDQYSHDTDESVLTDELVNTGKSAQIVVYNDDVNTFDWVIECFIEILQHSYEQAEQLSLLIHFKGKAIVKTDTYEALKPKKDALVDRGLSAVIEEFVP